MAEHFGRVAWYSIGGFVLMGCARYKPIALAARGDQIVTRNTEGMLDPITPDHPVAEYIAASWNACDRLGLTAEQLNAGLLDRLVEAARAVVNDPNNNVDVVFDPKTIALRNAVAELKGGG